MFATARNRHFKGPYRGRIFTSIGLVVENALDGVGLQNGRAITESQIEYLVPNNYSIFDTRFVICDSVF